jgi:hypothetical protein
MDEKSMAKVKKVKILGLDGRTGQDMQSRVDGQRHGTVYGLELSMRRLAACG